MTWLQTIWNWNKAKYQVAKLQEKIRAAYKARNKDLVAKLQRILVNSAAARALAIRRILQNKGANTPGVDGFIAKSPDDFWNLINWLAKMVTKPGEYKARPVKRVYIPKAGSTKLRPLGIPTVRDRTLQVLYTMALEPIAEEQADKNSFGFIPKTGTLDAVFTVLFGLNHTVFKPEIILDADIKGFFDNISHEWILNNIPMDKKILRSFLEAGFLQANMEYDTLKGVPQGGPISPVISNLVLDGLQAVIEREATFVRIKRLRETLLFVRYADDFMVLGLPAKLIFIYTNGIINNINKFLVVRGLALSDEKTKLLTRKVGEGFDFLGFSFKWVMAKTTNNLFWMLAPSQKAILAFIESLREEFLNNIHTNDAIFLQKLNAKLLGWANYFKYGYSGQAFQKMDRLVWKLWYIRAKKKYNKATTGEVINKLFHKVGYELIPKALDRNGKLILVAKISKIKAKPIYGPIRKGKYEGQTFGTKSK